MNLWEYANLQYYEKYGESSGFEWEEDQMLRVRYRESHPPDSMATEFSLYGYYTRYGVEWGDYESDFIHILAPAIRRKKILDVGCGVGKYSLLIKKLGGTIYPIDIAPVIVDICHRRGLNEAKVRDMRNLSVFTEDFFDNILCVGGVFGELGSLQDAKDTLTEFYRVLKKNGSLLITSWFDPNSTLAQENWKNHKELLHIRYEYLNRVGKWYPVIRFKHDFFKTVINNAGFQIKSLDDDPDSSQYLVVARKQ